ncbi:hypothetical protein BGW36DRAFT_433956 [Talaromyces proteolyticus]|uniref:Uncharacterized protein n=1 Tax=Talaromyces proteolyticus TaxID=1131652 RepID=A0AAD4PRM8_9EURO|nr:uncharacterized protein BGW36DRAFT_433956 [Talaromyces proteolyticus]KAH8689192.1 hypothetical protein BGW36DRAFT_433956 [Talaromyces proteolyticus]
MHIPDPNAFEVSTTAAALKKRKRDVRSGLWGAENIEGGVPFQLDYQDINMLAPTPRFIPESQSAAPPRPQWLQFQQPNATSATQKKRKILQPHSTRPPQPNIRPHSNGHTQNLHLDPKKPSPPSLTIPSFNNHRDPAFSGTDEDLVSPRTTTSPENALTPRSTMPPPVLRPCHVCHRKPSTKVMLDAYADCELCGQRACYICLRECNSLNCSSISDAANEYQGNTAGIEIRRDDGYLHTRPSNGVSATVPSRKICSCCAVEGLTDMGEEIVWCLDCVRREETNQQ